MDALVLGDRGAAICTACASLAAGAVSEPSQATELVYSDLSSVMTNDPRVADDFGLIRDASVVVRQDHIAWIGRSEDLPDRYAEYVTIDCEGRMAIPGFVDAGTEVMGTVPAARPDPDALIGLAANQLNDALAHGVTMLDVRVGGSGDPTIDTVMLAAARAACDLAGSLRVGITWVAGQRMDVAYLDSVMAPTVGRIASAVEMACDGSVDASGLRAQMAALRKLPVRVRLCEAEPSACASLAEGARSVEAKRWTVLPPATIPVLEPLGYLDGGTVDARSLWDAGGRPALATRSNPDRRRVAGLGLAITLVVAVGGLSPAEAIWSATRGGALAMGDSERGRLRVTDPADFTVLDGDDLRSIVDRPDTNPAWKIVVGGREPLQ